MRDLRSRIFCIENFRIRMIGVFDSGYGGLTILRQFRQLMPQYDWLYLGDNARAPYGTRSFDVVYEFTLQAVEHLFRQGCPLVILACNTASAKALRSIQQQILPVRWPDRRVLGVIRPTVEDVGDITRSRHVGVLATPGTINSHSYAMEIAKIHPDIQLTELACPMWVPIVECGEAQNDGADWYVRKYVDQIMAQDPQIDTLLLGCTHYPILMPKIRKYAPQGVSIVPQGELVARSLQNYLQRHPEIDSRCSRRGTTSYLTTENPEKFDALATLFLNEPVHSEKIQLGAAGTNTLYSHDY